MELNNFEAKIVELLTPYLTDLQKFVDERIVAAGISMTAAVVQESFYKEYTCSLLPTEFIQGFRIAVKTNKITGIVGVRKAGT